MRITCQRLALADAFQTVSGVLPTRTPRDVLQSVKFEIKDGRGSLLATDLEIGVRYELPEVESDAEGALLLPTSEFASILRETESETVVLEVDGDVIWVRCGPQSEFKLGAKDPSEFPPVAGFEEERYFVVGASDLRQAIRRTVFATDVESTRYALGGVLLEFQTDVLRMVATDGRRLARVELPFRSEGLEAPENDHPIIPSKALTLVERSIDEQRDEEVRLTVHSSEALVQSGPATVSCRLLEGRFPPYREAIPKAFKYKVDLPCAAFHRAVRQAQIVVDAETRGVDFFFTRDLLTLRSAAADRGEAKVECPIAFDGDDLVIRFDPQYLVEFLRVLDPGTNLTLQLIDGESAAQFTTEDGYLYLVMPLERPK
ncbi:MAG TPA: DNA polymerase III subunit beta [Planctomycetaceae bacterium]|nr:DNA polymerase III subunit beta [Planctomycetaceae bacterium]